MALSIDAVGELKIAGDNAGNGDIFVERFPTEGVAIQSQGNFSQLILRRTG